jgi:hypothetical protein
MSKLTQERLKELLHYNPETGIFTRKCNRGNTKKGDIAGTPNTKGYLRLEICKKPYLNHRLAWLYVYGYFPENEIDHIDRDKTNNKISNLKEASRSCNMRNTKLFITNTSGVKGVAWDKYVGKWAARITVNLKFKGLGSYNNFDNAVCARLAAEQCLNWSGCDSSSSAYKYVQKMLKKDLQTR